MNRKAEMNNLRVNDVVNTPVGHTGRITFMGFNKNQKAFRCCVRIGFGQRWFNAFDLKKI